jgi:endoglucanase
VARHGKLRIENGKLVNQCGRTVQFTSMSLYDWSQQGRQFYNATAVKNLFEDKKCASLRIPLLAANYPSQYPRVKTVLDACIATGIYCIPNWHVIGSSDVTNAKAFYVQLANDYGTTPNIIYEPWNEPTTATWAQIKSYMEEILAAIRPIDPDNLFLAGNRQWDQRPDEACASPINDAYVGYVFHFYANTHTLTGFKGTLDKCLNAKQLLWATEYGGCSSGGSGTLNATELNKWWDYVDQNLISSNAWAIETNPETSSVFVSNASSTGPWPDSQLTDWGKLVFAHIAENYPVTMSQ